jgi:hypothetical protein
MIITVVIKTKKHKQIHSLKPAVILFMIVHGNSKNSGELGSAQNNANNRAAQHPPDELDTFGT